MKNERATLTVLGIVSLVMMAWSAMADIAWLGLVAFIPAMIFIRMIATKVANLMAGKIKQSDVDFQIGADLD